MNTPWSIYPAIDLRRGQVVRLQQGDPERQTTYSSTPAAVAAGWRAAGADWLHVVSLDGAFGQAEEASRQALRAILQCGARIQFGGGLRTLADLEALFDLGVARAVLGTAAVENPDLVRLALQRFGPQRIAVGLDVRAGQVRTRGWQSGSHLAPAVLGKALACAGLKTLIYTDIARDGMQTGPDIAGALALAQASGLDVIVSGGIGSLEDVRRVRAAGLPGLIIGRALYEGRFTLEEALQC